MFEIVEAQMLTDNIKKLVVKAENVAHACKPGQFLMQGERHTVIHCT